MRLVRHHPAVLAVVLASGLPVLVAADGAQEAFSRHWEGRVVTVRQTLYSLVYNERGRLGTSHNGRRDGLTVVTPTNGVYFQFDGRQSRSDVAGRDPQRLVDAVSV